MCLDIAAYIIFPHIFSGWPVHSFCSIMLLDLHLTWHYHGVLFNKLTLRHKSDMTSLILCRYLTCFFVMCSLQYSLLYRHLLLIVTFAKQL
jgi:hypothetical protein